MGSRSLREPILFWLVPAAQAGPALAWPTQYHPRPTLLSARATAFPASA